MSLGQREQRREVATLARNGSARIGTVRYDPRELWATNVAPLVVAAREGANRAARTARAERARMVQRQSPWWRRRWVVFTASGLMVAAAAGSAYAVMTNRRSQAKPDADEMTSQPEGTGAAGGIKSTVEAGREKVADATRTVMHKIRRDGDAATMEQPAVGEHPRRNEMPATGTGYGPPR